MPALLLIAAIEVECLPFEVAKSNSEREISKVIPSTDDIHICRVSGNNSNDLWKVYVLFCSFFFNNLVKKSCRMYIKMI